MSPTYRKIYSAIRKIPRGRAATYGQIARIAGMPNQARLVGYALHALRDGDGPEVPWWRVINAKGEVSLVSEDDAELQRALLRKEGVLSNTKGRIDLKKYGWKK